ncbi:metal ABC transporter ATP-binding protein [Anaeromyxobacter oryzae]|uniref:metal ABC transporter ATP-binding protein n=1 Tax=Anaeromyxobacter oryzae TaxID=2918170 RepID=UPI0020C11F07|nr:metal ABC transporter ATP-binding protein [Anaeromyxobacter oryzae]
MGTVVEVAHVGVSFGRTEVLRDVGFAVAEGTTLAIIGPNGSGKTVLLRALIGAVPHRGTIRWAPGTRTGYVPQKLDIERDLPITGEDFLRAKAAVARAPAQDVTRARELVELAADVARKPIGVLSGGQFQRLLLAFALVGRPTVLLFDEPTAGVDEPGQEQLYETIHRVQARERLTLILVSHELSLVYRYATEVLCLGRGRPCFGSPKEVLTPETIAEMYGTPVKFHLHDR